MNVDLTDLINLISGEISEELKDEPTFNVNVLKIKIRQVCREVMMKRNYIATSMTDAQILDDLQNYISVIENLALIDYNSIGAEGEYSHTENGVSRTYLERDKLLKGVHAFVKVL